MSVIYKCEQKSVCKTTMAFRANTWYTSSATHTVSLCVDWPDIDNHPYGSMYDAEKYVQEYVELLEILTRDLHILDKIWDYPTLPNWIEFAPYWEGPFPKVENLWLQKIIEELRDPLISSFRNRCAMVLAEMMSEHFPLWWNPDTFPEHCYPLLPLSCANHRDIWEPYYAVYMLTDHTEFHFDLKQDGTNANMLMSASINMKDCNQIILPKRKEMPDG